MKFERFLSLHWQPLNYHALLNS